MSLRSGSAGAALALILAVLVMPGSARQARPAAPSGYIGGLVESNNGPEAGVWVIAETTDLPTRFTKIVVTNDGGQFVLPELPEANYNVWVRGYGLVDSKPVTIRPGATPVTLRATVAGTPQEAAEVYPANYWYSLIEPPAKSEFPGTGPQGNGIAVNMRSQAQWIDNMKQGCELCHQIGTRQTRTIDHWKALGFKTSIEAWDHRTQTGVRGTQMTAALNRFGRQRALRMFADWTDRIAAGEVPAAPPRPSGRERDIVVTLWDWGTETSFIHDEISTSKNAPRVNPYGPIYGASAGHGTVVALDPVRNEASEMVIPTRDDPATIASRFPPPIKPSFFYGTRHLWSNPPENPADPHNPMMDRQGRLWLTSTIRGDNHPSWCTGGSNKYAQYFPAMRSGRQASYLDPATKEWTLIDTCFGTHHLQFSDNDEFLFFSGGGPVVGWLNTVTFAKTKDEQASQGWCPTVLDTNGDGRITKPWNDPVGTLQDQERGGGGGQLGAFDPKLDTRVAVGSYGVIVSPVDNALWAASTAYPGSIVRLDIGNDPPSTCRAELYQVPTPDEAYAPRGIDIDRDGVVWVALSGSSHFASFDRRKCTVFGGAEVRDGTQCAQGWTLYEVPGPNLKGTDVKADFQYYNWVDQHNTLGFGENIPMATGTGSDSIQVLDPATRTWLMLRVPYPLGFFSRGLDGRIDDPDAGWKGRGLWANYGTNYLWHTEGGKGTKSKVVRFQLRPDPLAR